jgi:hypothetical protein
MIQKAYTVTNGINMKTPRIAVVVMISEIGNQI